MMHSPLRYPGGKSDFLAIASDIFTSAGFLGMPVVEPFAGSAAVSLGLLDHGLTPHITLLERDPLIYSFWKCVFERTDDLIVRFQDLPITLDTWHTFQKVLKIDSPNDDNLLDLGIAGLFFNRTNYSGILNAGPIGGKQQRSEYKISCRTNKDDIIARILSLAMLAPSVSVEFGDAVECIRNNAHRQDCFFYLDPPYFNKGASLYRHHYKLSHHKNLADALAVAKFKWLLSYDVHHVIEFLYEDFHVRHQSFRYSAHSPKRDDELLISNFEVTNELVNDVMARRQRHFTLAYMSPVGYQAAPDWVG
jgi:DNA adenine methylase